MSKLCVLRARVGLVVKYFAAYIIPRCLLATHTHTQSHILRCGVINCTSAQSFTLYNTHECTRNYVYNIMVYVCPYVVWARESSGVSVYVRALSLGTQYKMLNWYKCAVAADVVRRRCGANARELCNIAVHSQRGMHCRLPSNTEYYWKF